MGLKDDLSNYISNVLGQNWDIRDGRLVADSELALESGIRLDATVLCADLMQSSKLTTDFQQRTAAKVVRVFLRCMSKLVTTHGGTIASFDGERVMGVFLGDMRNTNAATCALKMNYVASKMITPIAKEYFTTVKEDGFNISHCVGIDTSPIIVVRAGVRSSNDIVWVGRAPQLATKLSQIRDPLYHSYISEDVFFMLFESAKFSDKTDQGMMWEESRYEYLGESIRVYRSNWNWEP